MAIFNLSSKKRSLSPTSTTMEKGYYEATTLDAVDTDFVPGKLKNGTTVFGVLGTYTGLGGSSFTLPTYEVQNFTDNGNGTITDNRTGLMWVKDAGATTYSTWSSALTYCNNLVYAGHDDWRLPTIIELMSLMKYKPSSGEASIDLMYFPNTQTSAPYWSSTTNGQTPTSAWMAWFGYSSFGAFGSEFMGLKTGPTYPPYVRPVRFVTP